MGKFSELQIAAQEADRYLRQRDDARTDLGRARMLLATARMLVSEERAEINLLRSENEILREQLWSVSTIRSRKLGLEPR